MQLVRLATTLSCVDVMMLISLPVLAVVTLNLLYLTDKSYTEDNFQAITSESCACPGDEIIFECTIEGDAGTYWQGTALEECLHGRILIHHSDQFQGGGFIGRNVCGDSGTVIIRTISAVNNTLFTTQLTIFAKQQLNGRIVECANDSGRVIGRSQILLTTASRVTSLIFNMSLRQRKLMFTWVSISGSCPVTDYKIISSNCGDCPRVVNSGFATCNNFLATQVPTCTFTVQSLVCGNILGEAADPIAVSLINPSPPQITHVDVLVNGSVHIFFNTADSHSQCQISHNPSVSYAIKYFDQQNNLSCGLDTTTASACTNQMCNSVFDLDKLCSNSTHISVVVFSTDVHGDEQESEPFLVVLQYAELESDDNANVHGIMKRDITETIIIIVSSILAGTILLLLLAIITLLPLTVLNCRKYRSRRFNRQQIEITSEEPIPSNGANNRVENVDVQNETEVHDDRIRGNMIELVTMALPNNSNDSEESEEEKCHEAEVETVIYENKFHDIDKSVNLDNLLIQIRQQVTPKWYQFGLAVGIDKETLDEFSNFSPEECIVEMLDLWLRTSERAITWRDVADALKQIGLYRLAEQTLKTYKTGKLLTGLRAPQSFPQLNLLHPYESMEQLASKPPNIDNGIDSEQPIPPLPPMTYQCTSELR